MVASRRRVVIGARGSSLSLCQTHLVQAQLEERVPQFRFTIKTITTAADRRPEASLMALGGEGIFVKELEHALLDGQIDLAVHSLKDLPLEIPEGLMLAAVCEREDASDALVARDGRTLHRARHSLTSKEGAGSVGGSFDALPTGARVGTSSLRRMSQLLHRRRDVAYLDIRGNVDTRLRKLEEGRYDAIVLAACGLIRLGLEERISYYFPMEQMLPVPGQGAVAIEAG